MSRDISLDYLADRGYDPTPDWDAKLDFDDCVETIRKRIKSMPFINQQVWHYLYRTDFPLRKIARKLKKPLISVWKIKKEIWKEFGEFGHGKKGLQRKQVEDPKDFMYIYYSRRWKAKQKGNPPPSMRSLYKEFLQTPQWKKQRKLLLKIKGKKCEKCGKKKELHIHHLHYGRFMKEKPEDVLILCKDCHRRIHKK